MSCGFGDIVVCPVAAAIIETRPLSSIGDRVSKHMVCDDYDAKASEPGRPDGRAAGAFCDFCRALSSERSLLSVQAFAAAFEDLLFPRSLVRQGTRHPGLDAWRLGRPRGGWW